jgi:ABC-2 type transport system ATP-binding protein
MRPVIELEDLRVTLAGRPVLRGLQGALRGRCVGLLGPNGAGKSTLINTLLGFHPPAGGTARVFGRDVRHELRAIRAQIGYMPENDAFISEMTAVRFVRYLAELAGVPPRLALERTHEALLYVGLGEARYRKLGTYSLGMRQMVKLAQAIVHGPRLLLLDEPTNGLDPPGRQRMLRLIAEIRDTEGVHVLVSSHLLHDVEEVCDEVLILKDGRVAAQTNLEEERRTQRRFLEVETSGAPLDGDDAFAQDLTRLGCACARFGEGRFKLVLPETVPIRQLYAAASARGVQIRRLASRRDSLEDIFLKAMGTLEGSPNPPATGSGEPSSPTPTKAMGTLEGSPNPPATGSGEPSSPTPTRAMEAHGDP